MIENFDYSAILHDLALSTDYVSDIKDRTVHNKALAEYFIRRFEETGKDSYFRRNYAISGCGQMLLFDFHNKKRIADLIRLELCHDRFCLNCAKMRQATYLQRFMPHILALSDEKEIFHVVFTAPNVSAEYLSSYVKIFYTAFYLLIRILRGTDKIRGIDFASLGFAAALRNTEITYLRKDYHLHIHSIFAINKDLYMPKIHRNKFSYDYSSGKRIYKRSFSDFEIFLQKLWRILVDRLTAQVFKFGLLFIEALPPSSPLYRIFQDNVALKLSKDKKKFKITLDVIRSMGINDGYSVICDPVANEDFVQVFKYAFKTEDEHSLFMSYDNFVALDNGTRGKHLMQGYGLWRNMKCDDSIEEGFDEFFDVFKAYLWQVDRPESVNLTPDETLAKMREGEYTFITRSKLRHILQEPAAQELMLHKDEFPPAPKPGFSFPDLGLAYDRYLRNKEQSRLFASVQKVTDPDNGNRLVILSEQQLNFLQTIF